MKIQIYQKLKDKSKALFTEEFTILNTNLMKNKIY